MILETIYRNLAAILVFFTIAGVTWIYGGTRPDPLIEKLPWFLALTLEGLLFFPQRRPYEDTVQARERTWRLLRRDPLFYVMPIFMALLLVPIFKDGELVYDSPSESEIRAYCADRIDGLWDEIKRFENPHTYFPIFLSFLPLLLEHSLNLKK